MLGFGAGNSMNKSYQQNRNLLGKKKALKDLMKENSASYQNPYTFAQSSPEKLEQLRIQLREEKRKSTLKLIALLIAIFFILGTAAYWLLFL